MKFVYLDYQASTPMDEAVITAMYPFYTKSFANPNSTHFYGLEAWQAVETAREMVAAALSAKSNEIFFTSGATEANNLAIKGLMKNEYQSHIITVTTEHKSVLECCKYIEKHGHKVTYLLVDHNGLFDLSLLEAAITTNTKLISVMYGNNEIGTVQPIAEIGKIAKKYGVNFHCDASQGIAYSKIDVKQLGIDILTFSAHKIYGPKGIGGIYIDERLILNQEIVKQIHGGGQEGNLRGGTLNVPGIVGLGKAIEILDIRRDIDTQHVAHLQAFLWSKISQETNAILNGSLKNRLPNNLNISFPGIFGQKFLELMSNLAISAGSACNSNSNEPSHVLTAIGTPLELIKSSFRLSLGRYSTQDEIEYSANCIIEAFKKLYKKNLAY